MKFLVSQLTHFMTDRETRGNVRALLAYVAFLVLVIVLYALLFQLLMARYEGQAHSWMSGIYWTIVTMTTLGFGDITFVTDIGRAFSVLVLMSGVVLLLVVLPFTFIRYFYAPWLEAQVRLRAPRRVPEGTRGHLVAATLDSVAAGLIERLRPLTIPYFVIEPDPAVAARRIGEGVPVVTGEIDSRATYEALRVSEARLVLANCEDTTNTNIALTVREAAPDVAIVAIVEHEDSVDILALSGCTHVLPLKQRLGEHLANRISGGRAEAHVIGGFKGLQIAELPVRNTPLAGRAVRNTELRRKTGLNLVGVWERGRLLPAFPDTVLTDQTVVVVVGSPSQMTALNELLGSQAGGAAPVLVIGGGKVGEAAVRALRRKRVPVHVLDRDERASSRLAGVADRVFVGDAADRDSLMAAGLEAAPSVLLTTNDDAMNVYLAVYCRRLRPDVRIVSRVTHERNIEAIHRAGADFVLSYASLGVEAVFSLLRGQELVMLGEGLDLFEVPVPRSLAGKTLAETGIGSRTGLSVVAVQQDGDVSASLSSDMRLAPGSLLYMIGSAQQRQVFAGAFEQKRRP